LGGNDITEFLYVMLQRIGFPYKDADLSRTYDWAVFEDLKKTMCTLTEASLAHFWQSIATYSRNRSFAQTLQADVALNLYSFNVRRPGERTRQYQLRAYDENILAPMCIFEPRVVEFDNKRQGPSAFSSLGVDEEIVANPTDKMVGDVPVRMYKFMSEY
jgi:actin-related protein 8